MLTLNCLACPFLEAALCFRHGLAFLPGEVFLVFRICNPILHRIACAQKKRLKRHRRTMHQDLADPNDTTTLDASISLEWLRSSASCKRGVSAPAASRSERTLSPHFRMRTPTCGTPRAPLRHSESNSTCSNKNWSSNSVYGTLVIQTFICPLHG